MYQQMADAQSAFIAQLNASVAAFKEANPEITITALAYDTYGMDGESSLGFRSTMSFKDETGATVTRNSK